MSTKTIQIALCFSLLFSGFNLFSQDRFQIGLGLVHDLTYLDGVDQVVVGDSLFFTNGPGGKKHSFFSDPRFSGFLKWSFLSTKSFDLSISAVYSKKYTNVTLWRTSEFQTATGQAGHNDFTIFQVRNALFIPVQVRFKPFGYLSDIENFKPLTEFSISFGGGPVFSDNALSPGERNEFSPGLLNQRMDPLFTEFMHQFIHQNQRITTFDYSVALETEIVWGLGLQAMWSGSVGTVSKPIRVIGYHGEIPLKRRSMQFFLTYSFDLG